MAELHVLGPWEGPCEEKSAALLASKLPQDWHVVCGRKLPTNNRDDIDFIVIGKCRIFVIEEKCWGPVVIIGDRKWEVRKSNGKYDFRINPQDAAALKSKKTKTWLKTKLPEFDKGLTGMAVLPVVLLSYEGLIAKVRNDVSDSGIENVVLSQEVISYLKKEDARGDSKSFINRNALLNEILDQEPGPNIVSSLGDYVIDSEITGESVYPVELQGRFFLAHHKLTDEVFELHCFPKHADFFLNGATVANFARDIKGLKSISNLDRTVKYGSPFEEVERNWFVVPIENLEDSVRLNDLESPKLSSDFDLLSLAEDAFRGLADLHSHGVIHKYISPKTILIGRGRRIRFSHLFLSHFESQDSVIVNPQSMESNRFVAPESVNTGSFTEASDVFSLALSLTKWISPQLEGLSDFNSSPMASEVIGQILSKCLSDDPASRPSALEVINQLADAQKDSLNQPAEASTLNNEFVEGGTISGRFDLQLKLGAGGLGIAWLAFDKDDSDREVVVKQLRSSESYDAAAIELQNSRLVSSPDYCRGVTISDKPGHGYLTLSYFNGLTIKQKYIQDRPDTNTILELIIRVVNLTEPLHTAGYIHGDLNTRNILVDDQWHPKLIDFGTVRKIGQAFDATGTPMFASPENVKGEECSQSSDFYTLSASILSLMLGRSPFAGEIASFSGRSFETAPVSGRELAQWDQQGQSLMQALMSVLQIHPGSRPQDSKSFIGLLLQTRPIEPELLPPIEAKRKINPKVDEIRKLYTSSAIGAEGAIDLANQFAWETYVPSALDANLLPEILLGKHQAIFLTGNPGDGKTSFIQQIESTLLDKGAERRINEGAFWEISLGKQTFGAVLDCSASFEGRSADEIVSSFLSKSLTENYTSIFAINDGRLRQFFENNADIFEKYSDQVHKYFLGEKYISEDFLIVDLKDRALENLELKGITSKIVSKIVDDSNFVDCKDCSASPRCPIYRNARDLSGSAGPVFSELVLQSHLRRNRRATFRRVRSAVSWIITGDLDCESVHNRLEQNEDLNGPAGFSLADLAFSPDAHDSLILEWVDFDPANQVNVEIENYVSLDESMEAVAIPAGLRYSHAARKAYFSKASPNASSLGGIALVYESYTDFLAALKNPDSAALGQILSGVSAVLGAPGYEGEGLAITVGNSPSGWSFIKPIPAGDFKLDVSDRSTAYIEGTPDQLKLVHTSGDELDINLDTFEVIHRASRGEIFTDLESEPIRFEIKSFAQRLSRIPTKDGVVVSPGGVAHDVVQPSNGKIQLMSKSREFEA